MSFIWKKRRRKKI